jgi:hypothetical protein
MPNNYEYIDPDYTYFQNTLRYYYYVPNTSVGYYTARLHVTAR